MCTINKEMSGRPIPDIEALLVGETRRRTSCRPSESKRPGVAAGPFHSCGQLSRVRPSAGPAAAEVVAAAAEAAASPPATAPGEVPLHHRDRLAATSRSGGTSPLVA